MTPTPQQLQVRPIPMTTAKRLIVPNHYLHAWPGATKLAFGVFTGSRLQGAVTLGAGPANAHRLVEGAVADDCVTLSRLWLDDELPRNSESRVIGLLLRALRQHTKLGFVLSYADPAVGHVGTIYQATNWLYTGFSEASPLYSLDGGTPQHSRTVAQIYGTHSLAYLRGQGIDVEVVSQEPKHRYVYLLDPKLRAQLTVPVLPYPKREVTDGNA